ncbi:MAG: hypothetical protein RJB58_1208 [Pseudomonadota bacterium]|jgi:hypothetical protein
MPRVRNSQTRPKGNGPGYGGPARGAGLGADKLAGKPFAAGNPGRRGGPKTPWHERKAELAAKAMDTWEAVLDTSESESNRIAAAEKIMNRVEGMPKQTQEHRGDLQFLIATGVPRADD